MLVMCLNGIWFSKQLWRKNCNKIWLNRIIRFWYDFIRCHASGRFFDDFNFSWLNLWYVDFLLDLLKIDLELSQ